MYGVNYMINSIYYLVQTVIFLLSSDMCRRGLPTFQLSVTYIAPCTFVYNYKISFDNVRTCCSTQSAFMQLQVLNTVCAYIFVGRNIRSFCDSEDHS